MISSLIVDPAYILEAKLNVIKQDYCPKCLWHTLVQVTLGIIKSFNYQIIQYKNISVTITVSQDRNSVSSNPKYRITK